MSSPNERSRQNGPSPLGDQAVVIGSGIAGLTAAKVLSDHFAHVTIVERDDQPGGPEYRRGVPQARHAHTLMPRGWAILEQHFPGLIEELKANGAVAIEAAGDIVFFQDGKWQTPRTRSAEPTIACSRPLLESIVYRRVAARANVHIVHGYETVRLRADEGRERVTGVELLQRSNGARRNMAADLVVDACGRRSRAPEWLVALGYMPPEEWAINSFVGYATRIYRRPADFAEGWKTMYIRPMPSTGTRGGIILPMEDGRWHVTLIGVAADYPPTDENGFLEFARELPTPRLYETIRHAEPLTKPWGFRRTENRVRRYDKLPGYLEGFLVCGDAAYALNPVYAQGMTAAVIGSLALEHSLQEQYNAAGASEIAGLAKRFQEQLSEALADLWRAATQKDWRWPLTIVTDTMLEAPAHALNPYARAGTSKSVF